jgi:chromosome segregation and condensation protein ScpB
MHDRTNTNIIEPWLRGVVEARVPKTMLGVASTIALSHRATRSELADATGVETKLVDATINLLQKRNLLRLERSRRRGEHIFHLRVPGNIHALD